MTNREIIKILGKEGTLSKLSLDELKLYLIFLVFAKEIKRKESIDFKTIKRAFGNGFTVRRLKKACLSLKKKGMIRIDLENIDGRGPIVDRGLFNFTLNYELLELKHS